MPGECTGRVDACVPRMDEVPVDGEARRDMIVVVIGQRHVFGRALEALQAALLEQGRNRA